MTLLTEQRPRTSDADGSLEETGEADAAAARSDAGKLRNSAMKGGAYLVGRQGISVLLKFIGVLLITRVLGPESYGTYVAAASVYQYAVALGSAGVSVYLLRHEGAVPDRTYRTAYTILVAQSLLLTAVFGLGTNMLARWIGVTGFDEVMQVMILALPFQLLMLPASAQLERELDYRSVALLEILGQVSFYLLAVPLVMAGAGPVSLACAWLAQQAASCIAAHWLARRLPRLGFHGATTRRILSYASQFSAANWIWQLRMLVNPMIVGPALGAHAVGLIGMTVGILEILSVVKTIAWRLSVAVLGHIQSDMTRMRKAVADGMELQILAVGTMLLGFGWTGQWIVPWLFGERWLPVMEVYPFIAMGYLTVAAFNMHSAALSVVGRNLDLALCHLLHIAFFASAAALLVPSVGLVGYGYAEIAALPAYLAMNVVLIRITGTPDYRVAALWWGATVIGLLWQQFGPWAIAVPFAALLTPPSLSRLKQIYRSMLHR